MRPRLRWAWRTTSAAVREHLGWHVALAVATLAIVEALWLWLHAQWTHRLLSNAVEALGVTVGAAIAIALLLFLLNVVRAGDRMMIEQLQTASTAEERTHLRDLRAWVGTLTQEVVDVAARVQRMRADGHYWDPYREDFELFRLAQSGALLATDRRTHPAYEALGNLRREMEALSRIVRERYNNDLNEIGLAPDEVLNNVEMREGDDLGSLDDALRTAERELRDAMRRLDG